MLLGQLVHAWVHSDSVPWPEKEKENAKERASDAANVADEQAPLPAGSQTAARASASGVTSSVPPQLARPWHAVCEKLGLPLILTAAGVDTWNWTTGAVHPSTAP